MACGHARPKTRDTNATRDLGPPRLSRALVLACPWSDYRLTLRALGQEYLNQANLSSARQAVSRVGHPFFRYIQSYFSFHQVSLQEPHFSLRDLELSPSRQSVGGAPLQSKTLLWFFFLLSCVAHHCGYTRHRATGVKPPWGANPR